MAIDCDGFVRHLPHYESLRAWQIFEADGRRMQVWRTQGQAIPDQLALNLPIYPLYQRARAFHYGVHPKTQIWPSPTPCVKTASSLASSRFAMLTAAYGTPKSGNGFSWSIFSPNLHEVETMIGPGEPLRCPAARCRGGAHRRLAHGRGRFARPPSRHRRNWHIPPVATTTVVDACGAGNAYCGGFLVGWVQAATCVWLDCMARWQPVFWWSRLACPRHGWRLSASRPGHGWIFSLPSSNDFDKPGHQALSTTLP